MKQCTSTQSSIPLNTPKRRKGVGLELGKVLVAGVLTAGVFLAGAVSSLAQTEGTTKWSVELSNPPGWWGGAPALGADGTIYAAYQYQGYGQRLAAVSPSGIIRWNVNDPNTNFDMLTPAIGADGTIYLEGQGGKGYTAHNPVDGSVEWSWFGGGWQLPAIGSDGTLYGVDRTLYAVNPDGTTKWIYQEPDMANVSYWPPAIGRDGTIYVPVWGINSVSCTLRAINPDGTLKWNWTTAVDLDNGWGSPAIGSDGTIYFGGTSDNRLFAIKADGTKKWEFVAQGAIQGGVSLGVDGTVFFFGGNMFYALNQDGTLKWQTPFAWKGSASCPAVRADGSIVVLGNPSISGWVSVTCLNPDGTIKWTNSDDDFNWCSSPAIGSDGTIYVQASTKLYAINGNSPLAKSPWPMAQANLRHTANAADQSGNGSCVSAPAGLIGWWKAENNMLDSVGANNGTAPYGIDYAPGEVGQAFSFDGGWSRVSIPDSDTFKLTNSLTIEGWVNIAADYGFIFFRGDNRPGFDPYFLNMADASGWVQFGIESLTDAVVLQAPIAYGQWQHLAATLDGDTGWMCIYVNGALAARAYTTIRPFADLDPAFEPAIGIGNHGGTYHLFPFTGQIDEISLYNRALSQSEIQSIYTAGALGKCPLSP